MSAFTKAMDSAASFTTGENGALENATTSNTVVDLFFKIVRDTSAATLKALFDSAHSAALTAEAKADLVVLAFQSRAWRDCPGKGERLQSYRLLLLIEEAFGEDVLLATLPLLPHYGYFKDLLSLYALKPRSAAVAERCLTIFAEQLKADEAELAAAKASGRTPSLSLAGKYAPREGTSFDKELKLATKLATLLYGSANKHAAQRKYRKLCSALNAALATPEVLMCAHRYAEIRFAKVASLCLQRHRKAFLNEALKGRLTPAQEATGNRHPNDADRVSARANLRTALLAKKGVKGAQLMPHELAKRLMSGAAARLSTVERDLMEAQWKAMREGVLDSLRKAAEARAAEVVDAVAPAASGLEDGALSALKAALPSSVDMGKLVPLIDVSGSMHGTPMEVAIGLGILVSECTSAAFRDRAITFESRPSWIDLTGCTGIAEKVAAVQSAGWGGSTNFAAACEMILKTAEAAKLTPDEIPDLIVFSDMQFDEAGAYSGYSDYGGYYGGYGGGYGRSQDKGSWQTHYEKLCTRFAEVGRAVCGQPYACPRIIFWNLRGNTCGSRGASKGFPVKSDQPNTQMLSGFSPALLKLVLTGAPLVVEEEEVKQADGSIKVVKKGPTPEQTVRAALDDAAFDPIRLKLSQLTSGPFKEYSFTKDELGFAVVAEEEAPPTPVGGESVAEDEEGFEMIA